MTLYFVEHKHRDDTCPTRDKNMMTMLGQHVMQGTADKFGVRIHADVVHPGEHTMNLVLEAQSPDAVANFVLPFLHVGSVSIKPVTTCEEVVAQARD